MVHIMKEILKMILNLEMEPILGQIKIDIKEIGLMEKGMDKALIIGTTIINILDNGKMIKDMAKVIIYNLKGEKFWNNSDYY